MIGLHRLNCTFESVSVDLSYVYHALKLPNTSRHDKQIQTNWNDYEAIFHVCVCVCILYSFFTTCEQKDVDSKSIGNNFVFQQKREENIQTK